MNNNTSNTSKAQQNLDAAILAAEIDRCEEGGLHNGGRGDQTGWCGCDDCAAADAKVWEAQRELCRETAALHGDRWDDHTQSSKPSSAGLYSQDTNERIRTATVEERAASIAAAETDGGCGWIVVDVDGTPTIVYAN